MKINKNEILKKIYLNCHEIRENFVIDTSKDFVPSTEILSLRISSSFLNHINDVTGNLGVSRNQLFIGAIYEFLKTQSLLIKQQE
jgi:hypothetical protein